MSAPTVQPCSSRTVGAWSSGPVRGPESRTKTSPRPGSSTIRPGSSGGGTGADGGWSTPRMKPTAMPACFRSTGERLTATPATPAAVAAIAPAAASAPRRLGATSGDFEQLFPHRVNHRFHAGVQLKLLEDVSDVVLHRVFTDEKFLGDISVIHSFGDELQDFHLAVGQPRGRHLLTFVILAH